MLYFLLRSPSPAVENEDSSSINANQDLCRRFFQEVLRKKNNCERTWNLDFEKEFVDDSLRHKVKRVKQLVRETGKRE